MRVLIIILCFVLAFYFRFHGVESNKIQFSLSGATSRTYKQFVQQLRQELSTGTTKVYNITVLKHQASAAQRFILIDLTNYNHNTITLGIDVFDVYLVGYLTGTKSYIFKEAPTLAYSSLFPGSTRTNLTYSGSYTDLERGAKALRQDIPLGISALDSAITNLFHYDTTSLPRSFLVIIQMFSEASRFKYIESAIAKNFTGQYKPDPAFISLENNWGALSTQIQEATKRGGQFVKPVVLNNVHGQRREVSNVSDPIVQGIALLLYHKVSVVLL